MQASSQNTSTGTEDDSAESLPILPPEPPFTWAARHTQPVSRAPTLHHESTQLSPEAPIYSSQTPTSPCQMSTQDSSVQLPGDYVPLTTATADINTPGPAVHRGPHLLLPISVRHCFAPSSAAVSSAANSSHASTSSHRSQQLLPPASYCSSTAATANPSSHCSSLDTVHTQDTAAALPSPHMSQLRAMTHDTHCAVTEVTQLAAAGHATHPTVTHTRSMSHTTGASHTTAMSHTMMTHQRPLTIVRRPSRDGFDEEDKDMPPLSLGGAASAEDPEFMPDSRSRSTRTDPHTDVTDPHTDPDRDSVLADSPTFAISASMVYAGGSGSGLPSEPGYVFRSGLSSGLVVMGRGDSNLSSCSANSEIGGVGSAPLIPAIHGGVSARVSTPERGLQAGLIMSGGSSPARRGLSAGDLGVLGSGVFLGRQGRELPQQQLLNLQLLYPAGNPYETPSAPTASGGAQARRLDVLRRQQHARQQQQQQRTSSGRHGISGGGDSFESGNGSFSGGGGGIGGSGVIIGNGIGSSFLSGSSGQQGGPLSSEETSNEGSLMGHVDSASYRSSLPVSRTTTWVRSGSSNLPQQLDTPQHQLRQRPSRTTPTHMSRTSMGPNADSATAMAAPIASQSETGVVSVFAALATWRAASPPPVPASAPSTPSASYTQVPASTIYGMPGSGQALRQRGLSRLGSQASRSLASSLSGSELFGL